MRWWFSARSIVCGWVTLAALAYLVERPLLLWTGPLIGASWFPTAQLTLDCFVLAATGWITGRLHRPHSLMGVLAFAATLTFWDFEPLVAINVPWLLRLTGNAFRDSAYLDSLIHTAVSQGFLFGSLIVGGCLSRPAQPPLSVFGWRAGPLARAGAPPRQK